MSALVSIRFEHAWSDDALRDSAAQFAADVAPRIAGLVRKFFVHDAARRIAGGVYLFADRASAEAYVAGPIVAALRARDGIDAFRVEVIDLLDVPSRANGAMPETLAADAA